MSKIPPRAWPLLALVAAAALTGMSFAATNATTTVSISGASGGIATVTSAGTAGNHGVAPAWTATAGTAGSVNTPGDLYIIDSGSYTGDLLVTLYLNNPGELAESYTYLNLAVVAYEWDSTLASGAGDWNTTAVAGKDGSGNFDTYLSLTGGYVSFLLSEAANGGKYSIGIDGGSFYAADTTNLSPSFHVDVHQA